MEEIDRLYYPPVHGYVELERFNSTIWFANNTAMKKRPYSRYTKLLDVLSRTLKSSRTIDMAFWRDAVHTDGGYEGVEL